MAELISIIVPVYNVERYISYCVESLINQTYPSIEIVIVDDGSTDESGAICDSYRDIDKRIKVIHKANGGVSAARNCGLKECTGNYITFVDGDDYVDRTYIELLYNNLISTGSDVSICSWKRTETYFVSTAIEHNDPIILNSKEILYHMLLHKVFCGGVCCVLYKKSLWENIEFPIGKRHAEDIFVNSQILLNVCKCALTRDELYYYYTRNNSTQNEKYSDDKMEEYDLLTCAKSIIDKKLPELSEATTNRLVSGCFHILFFMDESQLREENANRLLSTIKQYRCKMVFGRYVNKKVRLACVLSFFGLRITRRLYNLLNMRGKINI